MSVITHDFVTGGVLCVVRTAYGCCGSMSAQTVRKIPYSADMT